MLDRLIAHATARTVHLPQCAVIDGRCVQKRMLPADGNIISLGLAVQRTAPLTNPVQLKQKKMRRRGDWCVNAPAAKSPDVIQKRAHTLHTRSLGSVPPDGNRIGESAIEKPGILLLVPKDTPM